MAIYLRGIILEEPKILVKKNWGFLGVGESNGVQCKLQIEYRGVLSDAGHFQFSPNCNTARHSIVHHCCTMMVSVKLKKNCPLFHL